MACALWVKNLNFTFHILMNLDLNQRGSHEGHNYHYTYPMSPKFLVDVILCAHDIIYEKTIPKCCDWCMIFKYYDIWLVWDTYLNTAIWLVRSRYKSLCSNLMGARYIPYDQDRIHTLCPNAVIGARYSNAMIYVGVRYIS